MALQTLVSPLMTAEAFSEYLAYPENADRHFELIRGEIVEKMVVSTNSAILEGFLIGALAVFVRTNRLGYVTSSHGGYLIGNERYIPDAAFIRKGEKAATLVDGYHPTPPALAVEVLSPSDRDEPIRIKIANYLAAGVIVWLVDPKAMRVEVYHPGAPVQILRIGDTLISGDLLPGFSVTVRDIFDIDNSTPGDTP